MGAQTTGRDGGRWRCRPACTRAAAARLHPPLSGPLRPGPIRRPPGRRSPTSHHSRCLCDPRSLRCRRRASTRPGCCATGTRSTTPPSAVRGGPEAHVAYRMPAGRAAGSAQSRSAPAVPAARAEPAVPASPHARSAPAGGAGGRAGGAGCLPAKPGLPAEWRGRRDKGGWSGAGRGAGGQVVGPPLLPPPPWLAGWAGQRTAPAWLLRLDLGMRPTLSALLLLLLLPLRLPCPAQASPDGGLLQSSTVADRVSFAFADGETQLVPGAYIEFAERRVLPEFAHLKVWRLGWRACPGWLRRQPACSSVTLRCAAPHSPGIGRRRRCGSGTAATASRRPAPTAFLNPPRWRRSSSSAPPRYRQLCSVAVLPAHVKLLRGGRVAQTGGVERSRWALCCDGAQNPSRGRAASSPKTRPATSSPIFTSIRSARIT